MSKIAIGNKELELVVEEKVTQKGISIENVMDMVARNTEQLQEADINEEVLLMGEHSIILYKTNDQIVVTNAIGKESVH